MPLSFPHKIYIFSTNIFDFSTKKSIFASFLKFLYTSSAGMLVTNIMDALKLCDIPVRAAKKCF